MVPSQPIAANRRQDGYTRAYGRREELMRSLWQLGIRNEQVLKVMLGVQRHLFIDEAFSEKAYENINLPIGFKQTISQPYTVARMSELLLAAGGLNNVLEVGTGCGYQTAILSELAGRVYSIERIEALHKQAKLRLTKLGYRRINLMHGDGFQGWQSNAPFDGILVTAAPLSVPPNLLAQLADGGRMVIPVGGESGQQLRLLTRHGDDYSERVVQAAEFVPMVPGRRR